MVCWSSSVGSNGGRTSAAAKSNASVGSVLNNDLRVRNANPGRFTVTCTSSTQIFPPATDGVTAHSCASLLVAVAVNVYSRNCHWFANVVGGPNPTPPTASAPPLEPVRKDTHGDSGDDNTGH